MQTEPQDDARMEAAIAAPASSMPGLARRALKFLTVGASGLVVNQGLLQLLHGGLGWPLAGASVVAVECSILTNFTLNSLWTWRDQATPGARNWIRRGLQYHVVTLAAMVTNVVGVVVLSKRFGMDYRAANVLAIAAGSLATYLVSDRWVFRKLR